MYKIQSKLGLYCLDITKTNIMKRSKNINVNNNSKFQTLFKTISIINFPNLLFFYGKNID